MNSEPTTADKVNLNTLAGGVKIAAQSGLFKQLLFGFSAFIKQLFTDDSGNVSSMRALMLFAGVVILSTWSFICISKRELIDLPLDVAALLGGLTGLKLTQRKIAEANGTEGAK